MDLLRPVAAHPPVARLLEVHPLAAHLPEVHRRLAVVLAVQIPWAEWGAWAA